MRSTLQSRASQSYNGTSRLIHRIPSSPNIFDSLAFSAINDRWILRESSPNSKHTLYRYLVFKDQNFLFLPRRRAGNIATQFLFVNFFSLFSLPRTSFRSAIRLSLVAVCRLSEGSCPEEEPCYTTVPRLMSTLFPHFFFHTLSLNTISL